MNKVLLSILIGCYGAQVTAQRLPNVIYILADDIGYTDWGCYGATKIKTPTLDQLAFEGVRFTNAYAPASTSSPSRFALLTGEYAWRKMSVFCRLMLHCLSMYRRTLCQRR